MSLLATLFRPKSTLPAGSTIARGASMTVDSACRRIKWREEGGTLSPHLGNDNDRGKGKGKEKEKEKVKGNARRVEDIFIRSLIQASSCRRCADHVSHGTAPGNRGIDGWRQQRHHSTSTSHRRNFSAAEAPADEEEEEAAAQGKHISRAAYADLGLTYSSPSDLWEHPVTPARPPAIAQNKTPPNYLPLAPRLVLTPEQENRPPHTPRQILPPESEEHAQHITRLRKLLKPGKYSPPAKIWRVYLSLPTPRPRYLADSTIHQLFRRLAHVQFKSLPASQRYFHLLEECLAAQVPLHVHEWNTAISFAGRYLKLTTPAELRSAVETWMRMENMGLAATNVTFNILFDVAIRAGRFALADTIWRELRERGMVLNRYFRTSVIYYAGLKRDGEAVRRGFRELVAAGEIVDTAVMNCVILSLIRAGEGESAENVFVKMKHLHETKFGTPNPRNWAERRAMGIQLHRTAEALREEKAEHESSFFGSAFSADEKREQAQRRAPIRPDWRSCGILIRWHCLRTGNLDRVRELVDEMRELGGGGGGSGGNWRHGSVFMDVFWGFGVWGGPAAAAGNGRNGKGGWDLEALEGFWGSLLEGLGPPPPKKSEVDGDGEGSSVSGLRRGVPPAKKNVKSEQPAEDNENDEEEDAVDEQAEPLEEEEDDEELLSNESLAPYFTPQLAKRALFAFYKCAGREKMLQVWTQIQEKWPEMTDEERAFVEDVVGGVSV